MNTSQVLSLLLELLEGNYETNEEGVRLVTYDDLMDSILEKLQLRCQWCKKPKNPGPGMCVRCHRFPKMD